MGSSFALAAATGMVVLAASMGCGDGEVGGSGASQGSGGVGAGSSGAGAGASGSGASAGGAAASGGGGAPGCRATTLAEAVRVTEVTADAVGGQAVIYAPGAAGAYVAFEGSDGKVHVTPLDALDQRAGDDLLVDAAQPFGLAATSAGVFLLASRAPDYMTFFHLDTTGTLVASVDLVGGGDHDVEGTEWFGEFARTGKLVATADDRFAAYIALHRHWPDGIGHQGDTLRLLDGSGTPQGGGWDWGCSHSMDQRIAATASTLGPICIADCYPAKGIFFANGASEITDDPTANCAGSIGTVLGGMAAVSDGFWLSYGKGGGGSWEMNLVKLGLDGAIGTTVPLDAPGGVHRVAVFDTGLLSATGQAAGGTSLRRADLAGAWIGDAETLPELSLPAMDEISPLPGGEVGWATAAAGKLAVVRVRKCN